MDNLGEKTENEILPVLSFQTTERPTLLIEPEQIPCLKCAKHYEFPTKKAEYLAHLFLEHRLVIADVEEIHLLPEYLKYWKNEFNEYELEEYCTTMLLDQLPDGTPAHNERYYLLSDVIQKDRNLRKQLQHKNLEQTLSLHQYELTDRSFSKECLYCRDVINGLRADFLEHLFNKHFLQLGKPENLVYIDALLAKVQSNLDKLICLYCEKVFKDRVTLKEHMRKKAHKRINPNNRAYDQFFLVNYRNVKPTQQTKIKQYSKTQATTARRCVVKMAANITQAQQHRSKSNEANSHDFEQHPHLERKSDDSDSDWSDWGDEHKQLLNCLFCAQQEAAFAELKAHMRTAHHVDFDVAVRGLNFYQKVKVVNYVRRQIFLLRCVSCNVRCENNELLLEHMSKEQHYSMGTQEQWDRPEFFFPVYEDDGLLCILDDNPNDDMDDTVVRIISEDTVAQINKDAERLSLENFSYL